jgi:hypothetical protein
MGYIAVNLSTLSHRDSTGADWATATTIDRGVLQTQNVPTGFDDDDTTEALVNDVEVYDGADLIKHDAIGDPLSVLLVDSTCTWRTPVR